MPYLNVDLDFFEHPKTRRLEARCGENSYVHLINLWNFAGKFHPADGDLSRYTIADIESFARWKGDPGAFFKAISEVGFLDTDLLDLKRLHDWADHQGHLVAFKERASVAARKRWDKLTPKSRKRKTIPKDATSIPQAQTSSASSMLESDSSNAPTIPTILTIPTDLTKPDEVIGDAPLAPTEEISEDQKCGILASLGIKKRDPIITGDVIAALKKWIAEKYTIKGNYGKMAGFAYSKLLQCTLGKHREEYSPEPAEFFEEIMLQGLGEPKSESEFYAHVNEMCAPGNGQNLHEYSHEARRRVAAAERAAV